MGSKPKKPKVPKVDIQGDLQKYISGLQASLPQILASEAQNRPQFQALNLGDVSSFMGGVGGQEGIFGLGRRATEESARQMQAARATELANMTGQTGQMRGLMQALSPEQANAVALQQQAAERAQSLESEFQQASQPYTGMFGTMAEEAFARRGSLSPEEQRASQQMARESSAASGRIGGNAAISQEILNREASQAARRAEATQAAGLASSNIFQREQVRGALRGEGEGSRMNLFNMAQGFYTAPGLATLQSAPLSYSAGQNQLGLGLGAIGAGTPQLYDVGMGLNLGAAQRQNVLNANMAGAQAKATYQAGLFNAIGNVAGSAAQIAAMKSDIRIKTDIKRVGATDSGLPVYTFKYKGSDQTVMGVMAQDVEEVMPEAVTEVDGVKAVYYSMIG